MQRVPESLDATRHLLQYGLMGTSLKVILAINTKEQLPFVIEETHGEDEEVDKREAQKIALKALDPRK